MSRLIDADDLRQVLEVYSEKDSLGHTPVQLCDAMPTIDAVEVVHGSWIETDDFDEFMKGSVVCSNCRGQYQSLIIRNNEIEMRANKTPYCPNCGAKMIGDENEQKN